MPKLVTISDTKIRNAKSRPKEYNLSAGSGLHLRVSPTGSKTWLFNYSPPHSKKRTNLSLGKYPTISLADAIAIRDDYRYMLHKGKDPQQERTRELIEFASKTAMTFKVVYEKWLTLKIATLSENYIKRLDNAMILHVLPLLGSTPISAITAPDTIAALTPISMNRNFETLRKICGWLNEVMVYAVNTGLVHSNPLFGIKSAFESSSSTNYPCIKPAELPEFMCRFEEMSMSPVTRAAIEFMMHTMARPIEAVSTEWDQIDEAAALKTTPAEQMKKGRKHITPLPPQAMQIIDRMKPFRRNKYVFPSYIHTDGHLCEQTPNSTIKKMGYAKRMVAHAFRALASTILNEQGFNPEHIEVSLAHIDSSVRGDYNRAPYIAQRRIMHNHWSQVLCNALQGEAPNLLFQAQSLALPNNQLSGANIAMLFPQPNERMYISK